MNKKIMLILVMIAILMLAGCKNSANSANDDKLNAVSDQVNTISDEINTKQLTDYTSNENTITQEEDTQSAEEVITNLGDEEIERLLRILDTDAGIDWSIKRVVDLMIDNYDTDLEYCWWDGNSKYMIFNNDGTCTMINTNDNVYSTSDYTISRDGVIAIDSDDSIIYYSYMFINNDLYIKPILKSIEKRQPQLPFEKYSMVDMSRYSTYEEFIESIFRQNQSNGGNQEIEQQSVEQQPSQQPVQNTNPAPSTSGNQGQQNTEIPADLPDWARDSWSSGDNSTYHHSEGGLGPDSDLNFE